MQLENTAVWAGSSKTESPGRRLSAAKVFVIFATIVALFALGWTAWQYWTGLQAIRSRGGQIVEGAAGLTHQAVFQFVDQANVWVLRTVGTAAGGGCAFVLVVLLGSVRMHRRHLALETTLARESRQKVQLMQLKLSEALSSEESARRTKAELEQRLAEVSQSQAALQAELNQRKQAEKSLTQQTQQLERSKDVLEMHVQARAQELQKLQRRTELILNSAGEGICGFDLQGKATFVNPAAARITGWKLEEMVGKTEEEIFFPARFRGAAKEAPLLRDEKGEYLPEQVFYRKDGLSFPVEYLRTPIREKDKTVGTVVMFKDITERKLAEEKLAHKAAELARSNAELEQFAFVASHDLQEPLRKIQAFGDRLKLKCEAAQLQEGRDYLDRMQSASARMQTLINDLLTFSRIISSSQPFVPVDLAAVTKEVLVDLEVRIEKSKAKVEVGNLPIIDADPMQMRQLLQNLIGNALKFQAQGATPSIMIDARLVTRDQIREEGLAANPPPAVNPDDKFCVLKVKDNGIGFEEEYLEKIFAVFQRLHGRTEYEGTGVGLAVCRRITDRHGGLITAKSKPGEGATFIVILPEHHQNQPMPAK